MPPIPSKRVTSRSCRPADSRAWTRRSRHDSARQPHLGCGVRARDAAQPCSRPAVASCCSTRCPSPAGGSGPPNSARRASGTTAGRRCPGVRPWPGPGRARPGTWPGTGWSTSPRRWPPAPRCPRPHRGAAGRRHGRRHAAGSDAERPQPGPADRHPENIAQGVTFALTSTFLTGRAGKPGRRRAPRRHRYRHDPRPQRHQERPCRRRPRRAGRAQRSSRRRCRRQVEGRAVRPVTGLSFSLVNREVVLSGTWTRVRAPAVPPPAGTRPITATQVQLGQQSASLVLGTGNDGLRVRPLWPTGSARDRGRQKRIRLVTVNMPQVARARRRDATQDRQADDGAVYLGPVQPGSAGRAARSSCRPAGASPLR